MIHSMHINIYVNSFVLKFFLLNTSNFNRKKNSFIETKILFLDNEEINRESRDIVFPGTYTFGLFSIKKLHLLEKGFKNSITII